MQRRDQIVKTVAFVIEARAAFARNLGQQLRLQHPLPGIVDFGHIGHHFQRVQRPTRIAVNQFRNRTTRVVRQNDILPAVAARFVVHRLIQHLFDILGGQRFQQVNAGAGQQRRVQLKRRIFGGRADEGDGAVFNVRQKSILLALVEAVDFVHKQNGAPPGIAVLPRALDRLADLLHAGGHRRDAFDIRVGITGNHLRQRRFPGARRPPEDHGVQMPRLNGARQGFTGRQQVLLADVLR